MLVLTRRQGESICVGDGIVITVLSTNAGRASLGIQAPAKVRIVRQEVHARASTRDDSPSAAPESAGRRPR